MDTSRELTRASRLDAVRATGVGTDPDPDLDRFARIVSSVLGTPVALVTMVESDRQVFPGQSGLSEPLATARETPLNQSLCQYVTATGAPLIVADTRLNELTHTSNAITDLSVIAYAGVPLTDDQGEVFGALCAIDDQPREWSESDVALLTDLAGACNAELRMRIAAERAASAREEIERSRTQAELLLRAAQVLGGAHDIADLRTRVNDLITGSFAPLFVGLTLVDDQRLQRVLGAGQGEVRVGEAYQVYGLDESWPSSRAIAEQRSISVANVEQLLADGYGPDALAVWNELGLHSLVVKPMLGSSRVVGALLFGWASPHTMELSEDAVLTAVTGYAATAVERLLSLDNRITAANELQQAMLSEPVEVPGLEIAKLYRPASTADMVGGDWYDVHLLPTRPDEPTSPRRARPGATEAIAVTVGDIMGHDMRAAAIMGQARSMLRQAGIDAPAHSPARALEAVERAAQILDVDLAGTVVHGHLRATDHGWELVWTNAGHPSPIVVGPTGVSTTLAQNDVLLHPDLDLETRHDHRVRLAPGSVLLLYTDGLLDDRRADQDTMIAEIADAAGKLIDSDRTLDEVVNELAAIILGPRTDDDLAILAVRVS